MDIPHHPLVEALASDPNQPPKPATRLFGFPGPAADSKSTRLWLDEELSSYVDVPDDAILHSQTLAEDRGTLLWVDPGARLGYSKVESLEVQARFLGGQIAEANLGCAAQTAVPAAMFERGEVTRGDNPPCLAPMSASPRECETFQCKSEFPCQTRDSACPSDPPRCLPFTEAPGCPPPPAREVQAEFLGGAIAARRLAEAPFDNVELRGRGFASGSPFVCKPQLTIALECPFTTVCRTPLLPCQLEGREPF